MSRKKALITGGEYGMGRGIAACLAEAGYDIAFSYYPGMNDPLKAVETSEAILREKGAEVWCYPADLSKREAPKWLFDNAIADLKGLDLLVNNAGVNIPRPIQDITEDNFDYLVGLDFRAYVMMMHYASRYMIDNGIRGNIINITSSRGERAYANAGALLRDQGRAE